MKVNKVNGVNSWEKRSTNPLPSYVNGFMVMRVVNWDRYFKCRICGYEFRINVQGKARVKVICPNLICKNFQMVRGE